MNLQIVSIGEALPGRDLPGLEVSNERMWQALSHFQQEQGLDFALPDPSFAVDRVGVRSRRILDASLNAYDMALCAARQAVQRAGVDLEQYRVVVVSSVTPDSIVPPQSALLQGDLGLGNDLVAFDLPSGCNGFLSGIHLIQSLLAPFPEGSAGLLVTSEAMTRVVDATDRATCVIFGDAAAATVVVRSRDEGVGEVAWSTRGAKGPLIQIAHAPGPTYRFRVDGDHLDLSVDPHSSWRVLMQGRQVFKDMVSDLPERIQLELHRRGRRLEDYQLVAFHQANQRIVEAVCRRMQVPEERVLSNIDQLGNTSSASIPLLISQSLQRGQLQPDQRVLMVGFGTGYSVGVSELIWAPT